MIYSGRWTEQEEMLAVTGKTMNRPGRNQADNNNT